MPEKMILDADGAIRALRTVVFEKGADYVYPGTSGDKCFNFVDGEPSCIVGSVLALLGLTFEQADRLGVSGSSSAWDTTRELNLDDDFEWTITEQAKQIFGEAQTVQDNRKTWGEALAAAEAEVIRLVVNADRDQK
jgi:hypothetical protein